jgi:hypothetical protein
VTVGPALGLGDGPAPSGSAGSGVTAPPADGTGDQPIPGVSGGAGGVTADVWVDTNGGTCTRSVDAAYSDAAACSSFSGAYTAANSGDTVRIKTGDYPTQSVGGADTVTFIGETGTRIDTQANTNHGLSFSGNSTVQNVDVGGDRPHVFFSGANNTWESSDLEEGTGEFTCAAGDALPILIYATDLEDPVENTTLRDVVIGPQYNQAVGDTCGGDPKHMEGIRIDQNVDTVMIDRVTFLPGGDWGSGHIFITTPQETTTTNPTNITIRNSKFYGASMSFHMQVNSNAECANMTLAYNTFYAHEPWDFCDNQNTGTRMIGNLGFRPQSCYSGVTFTANVWQWSSGTACGTDTRVAGDDFETTNLGINATTLDLEAGSVAIDAGETPGASDYCTGDLGS